jgi:hypothetical protein
VVITPSESGRCNIGCGGIFRYPFPSVIIQMLVLSQIVVVVGVVYSCILEMTMFCSSALSCCQVEQKGARKALPC